MKRLNQPLEHVLLDVTSRSVRLGCAVYSLPTPELPADRSNLKHESSSRPLRRDSLSRLPRSRIHTQAFNTPERDEGIRKQDRVEDTLYSNGPIPATSKWWSIEGLMQAPRNASSRRCFSRLNSACPTTKKRSP
jgi:hypothetical protein